MAATLTLVHNKPIRRWPTAIREEELSRPETVQELIDLEQLAANILIHAANHLSAEWDHSGAWEVLYQLQCDAIDRMAWISRARIVGAL